MVRLISPMQRYASAIMLLTITQCCCVAIGLFIYDQYIVASVSQAAGLSADDIAALVQAQPQFRGLVIF